MQKGGTNLSIPNDVKNVHNSIDINIKETTQTPDDQYDNSSICLSHRLKHPEADPKHLHLENPNKPLSKLLDQQIKEANN